MYFDLLPKELLNTILVYLNNDELTNLEGIKYIRRIPNSDQIKIDFKELYRMKYLTSYGNINIMFLNDYTLRKYDNSWEILYLEQNGNTKQSIAYSPYYGD